MAIREDETAADCMGINPIRTKLMAFALGAAFSGLGGAIFAAKLQAIFPELFRFQVSIMLLCMVILGGMGNIAGVVIGGMIILLFDRVILAQSTQLVRALGQTMYQWTEPFVCDASKFDGAFGPAQVTPLREAVARTVVWYRYASR